MAKANLIHIKGNSFFFDTIFSIGVYVKDNRAVLIDSGISKDLAKDLNKALLEANCTVMAIINTHGHGDHCGGNAFFQENYPGIRIFSTAVERSFIEDPLMAPICFSGGGSAFEELEKCKPIAPQQISTVTDIITPYEDQKIDIDGETFEIITLPGHARGMIAVKTSDNVLYCGDAIFGEATIKKYSILYYVSIVDALHSFKKLKSLVTAADACILYHGGLQRDLSLLIDEHERVMLGVKDSIYSLLLERPSSLDEITAHIMLREKIPDGVVSYVLTRTSLQAYLAELERENRITIRVTEGVMRAHVIAGGSTLATPENSPTVM